MPTAPPRVCNQCRRAVPAGKRCPCRPVWVGSSWTSGSTRRHRKRRRAQLQAHPICQWPGCRSLATIADHIDNIAAGGDPDGPLQSLCEDHHDVKTQLEAKRGRGLVGADPAEEDRCP